MLVGPGGVVALVLGAWSAIWALRVRPGASGRRGWPVAAAFLLAMFAFAALSSFTETMVGMIEVVRGAPTERDVLLAAAKGAWLHPWIGVAVGSLLLAIGWFVGPSLEQADGQGPPLEADGWDRRLAIAGGVAAVGTLGLLAGVVTTVASIDGSSTDTLRNGVLASVLDHARTLQGLTWGGVVGAALVGAAALALTLRRWSRARAD